MITPRRSYSGACVYPAMCALLKLLFGMFNLFVHYTILYSRSCRCQKSICKHIYNQGWFVVVNKMVFTKLGTIIPFFTHVARCVGPRLNCVWMEINYLDCSLFQAKHSLRKEYNPKSSVFSSQNLCELIGIENVTTHKCELINVQQCWTAVNLLNTALVTLMGS